MLLPDTPSEPTVINPKRMVTFAHTKAGKTTALSFLPNHLILDLEEGTDFVASTKLDIVKEMRNTGKNPLVVLTEIGAALDAYYAEHKRHKYDHLILDTTSALEEFARKYATILYKMSPIGKQFAGKDVVSELPNGAGYDWLRQAFAKLLEPIENRCNVCFTLVSHVRQSSINKNGTDLQAKDLALTGKLKQIVCAEADAIGFLYRNPKNAGQTLLSFKTHEQDLATGARPEHLANQEFVVLELTNPDYASKGEPRIFESHWDKVFIPA